MAGLSAWNAKDLFDVVMSERWEPLADLVNLFAQKHAPRRLALHPAGASIIALPKDSPCVSNDATSHTTQQGSACSAETNAVTCTSLIPVGQLKL